MHCFAPARCHRPLKAEAKLLSGPRYRIPVAADFAENLPAVEHGLALPSGVAVAVAAAAVGTAVVAFAKLADYPVPGDVGMCRRAAECTDYTWNHLPVKKERAPLFSATDAAFAIFAARMAFSSLRILPSDKYGLSARSRFF